MWKNAVHIVARMCSYAQEHIDDADAWSMHRSDRVALLQCTSFQVACFISQCTLNGRDGVDWDVVLSELVEHPGKTEEEWVDILNHIANSCYGGWLE